MGSTDNPSDLTEQMFATVGRAITRWSFLEQGLCNLFSVCVGTGIFHHDQNVVEVMDSWTPMWVFYSVENFRSKLQMLDAALTARTYACGDVGRELQAEWARLSEKVRRLSRKRNKLAHWTVIPAQRIGTGAAHEPIMPARLTPPYGSPAYYRETGFNPPGNVLTRVQVSHIEKAFWLYQAKLREFTNRFAATEELNDRAYLQALRLLTSGTRLDPTVVSALKRALASAE